MDWMRLLLAASLVMSAGDALAQFAESGPILPTERNVAPAPRNVAADAYSDGFCAQWTDGCRQCARSRVNEAAECETAPKVEAGAQCVAHDVVCEKMLPSANRVCINYDDGCNQGNFFGGSTALICINGKTNFVCTRPRQDHYDDDIDLIEELNGRWRLIAPDGRDCEIEIGSTWPLAGAADCLAMPPIVREFQSIGIDKGGLTFFGGDSAKRLAFKLENFERLVAADGSGWRMERIDAAPVYFAGFQGEWNVVIGGTGSYFCYLMLGFTDRSKKDGLEILAPDQFAKTSECTARLPDWRSWRPVGSDIELSDARGRRTVFRPGRDGDCQIGQFETRDGKLATVALAKMNGPGMFVGGEHDCAADFPKPR